MSTNDVLNGTPWFRKVPRALSCRIRSARRRSSSHSENKRREYQRSEESNKHNERVVPSKKKKIKLLGSRRHNWNSLPLELKEWEWRKEEQKERKKLITSSKKFTANDDNEDPWLCHYTSLWVIMRHSSCDPSIWRCTRYVGRGRKFSKLLL